MATSNKICINFKNEELLARWDKQFPVRNAEANIDLLLEAYENAQTLDKDFLTLQQANATMQEQNQHLAEESRELQQQVETLTAELQQKAAELQNSAADAQKFAELQQKLAEAIQNNAELQQNLAEVSQKAIAERVSEDALILLPEPWVKSLLQRTAEKLSAKYKQPITSEQILIDMFLRYTVERCSEWFYPFVLNDKEIESATGYKAADIKKYIHR